MFFMWKVTVILAVDKLDTCRKFQLDNAGKISKSIAVVCLRLIASGARVPPKTETEQKTKKKTRTDEEKERKRATERRNHGATH